MRVQLRDYQQAELQAVRRSIGTRHRAPLLVAPTGSGKTVLFCAVAEGAARKGTRVVILVHRQELLQQTSAALSNLGVPHGLVSPSHAMTGDHVQVASVQTVIRRMDRMTAPDLIIIDECHHAVAGSWRKVTDFWSSAKIIGVTATPCRLDGRGLGIGAGGVFDDMVMGPSYSELQSLGFLVRPRVFGPSTEIDVSGVHRIAGDFNRAELEAVTDKPTITGDAVQHYSSLTPGEKAVAFCVSLRHAEHVCDSFKSAGYQWATIDGKLPDIERKRILVDLAAGYLNGICSVDLVSEGFDLPDISVTILLRKTESTGLYLQQVGRASRPAKGKEYFTVLDHVNNCTKHGMPNEDRVWSLVGKRRKPKAVDEESSVRQCKQCFANFSRFSPHCPECGAAVPQMPRPEPVQVAGTLKEITAEDLAARRNRKQEEGRAASIDDFKRIAAARGYSPKWAMIRWKMRQDRIMRTAS